MQEFLELISARRGHFLLESGHHGEQWLELERLFLHPDRVRPHAQRLAELLAPLNLEIVCGPLVEGAFVGLMVALELNIPFAYSERFSRPAEGELFPAGYRVPDALHAEIRGRRVAIVNDVINAGSAVRGTFADLEECEAKVIAIGALLVLGSAAQELADRKRTPLIALFREPNRLWAPSECPLCGSGTPLEDSGGFGAAFLRAT